ncbi:MAG: glycine cleavage system protein H, partial [Bryobacteraceae bacterium]
LAGTPETINADPHGGGWLVKMRLSAPQELDSLLSAADYEAYIAAEK